MLNMPNADAKTEELFHAALKCTSSDERNRFLDQACGGSPRMRSRIERLLRSHDKATDFLEQCPTIALLESDGTVDPDATVDPKPAIQSGFRIDEHLPRYFGDYELLEKIAHGGMGVVFKARQASLNRIVAIKVIDPKLAGSAEFTQRFEREARALAVLNHPNVVQVFDYGQDNAHWYLIMEWVDATSVA